MGIFVFDQLWFFPQPNVTSLKVFSVHSLEGVKKPPDVLMYEAGIRAIYIYIFLLKPVNRA